MKSDILVRRATIKDLEDILRLNLDLFEKERKEYDKKLDLKWTYGKIGRTYFKKNITDKNGFSIIAADNGKIIGYLCGSFKSSPYTYRIILKYAELDNMFVDEKFRSKGIGKKLAKEFLVWCKEKKADCISVNASIQNEKAIKFYHSLGFKDYSLTLEINR
ncbi:MAG: GNAT family N-acetyltransferase [Parcubacteria group bacterium]|jgi:ribosomal protein S18 acetylase RimI-like enzyme